MSTRDVPPSCSPVTPSVRSQKVEATPKPSTTAAPPAAEAPVASNASQRSQVGSQRSVAAASQRSHQSQGSQRSITSSVALGKLAQLEKLLLDERRAREEAESTMLALQRERIAKDEANKKFEATEKQLLNVMDAVKSVVSNPDNPTNIRLLKAVLQGKSTAPVAKAPDPSDVNSDGRPRSFLDGVGQYERERDRAKKEARAKLAKQTTTGQ